jgi:hypothetical protein
MRGETDKIKIGGDAVAELGGSEPGETTVESEKLGRREPIVKTKIFGKEALLSAKTPSTAEFRPCHAL